MNTLFNKAPFGTLKPSTLKSCILKKVGASIPKCHKLSLTTFFIIMVSIACSQKEKPEEKKESTVQSQPPLSINIDETEADYIGGKLWEESQQHLHTTHTKAEDLQAAVTELLENPNENSLALAQQEWQLAMSAYHQLSPLLYLEHSVAHPTKDIEEEISRQNTQILSDVELVATEALVALSEKLGASGAPKKVINHFLEIDESRDKIAAWPLQPGYLDSFGPHIHSGIVNDIIISINPHSVRGQHLLTDREEVTIGLYAIEYLLFGDQKYTSKKNTNFKRFVKIAELPAPLAQAGLTLNELPNNRRRALIELQARLLVNDIQTLTTLYQTNGALSIEFNELSALQKVDVFQRSIKRSLKNTQTLLSYDDLPSENNHTEDAQLDIDSAFTQRFIKNRATALRNNIMTIKSLYATSEPTDETIDQPSLLAAVLSDENKNNIAAWLTKIDEEIAKEKYDPKYITTQIDNISTILSM